MLYTNLNLQDLSNRAETELHRINHEIACQSRELRTKHGLFAKDIAALSGGLMSAEKCERIELERIRIIQLEQIIALGLLLKCHTKIIFEPMDSSQPTSV